MEEQCNGLCKGRAQAWGTYYSDIVKLWMWPQNCIVPKVTNWSQFLSVSQVTFPLLSLPNVVIHHLAGYLDPESTLFLGATCLSLGKVISKRVLARNAAIFSDTIGGVATLTKDLVQVKSIKKLTLTKDSTTGSKCPDKLWPKIRPG